MDPELSKDCESFVKKAKATPVVKKAAKTKNAEVPNKKEREKKMPVLIAPKIDVTTIKTKPGTSQYRFGVLAKIVSHMRKRHLNGDVISFTLENLLYDTKQLDVGDSIKKWLGSEALKNNPKIAVSSDGLRFSYKPLYNIKDGKGLLRLLKKHDLESLGGILLDDVQDSLPNCDKILKRLDKEITYVERPRDKKKILFYNDSTLNFSLDEEFKKLWHTIPIEGLDDDKIEEYLDKEGVVSFKAPKKPIFKRKVPVARKRQPKKPRDNEHLADVLETYDDN